MVKSSGRDGDCTVLWMPHPHRRSGLDQEAYEPVGDPVSVRVRATPELGPREGGIAQNGVGVVVGGQHRLCQIGEIAVVQRLDLHEAPVVLVVEVHRLFGGEASDGRLYGCGIRSVSRVGDVGGIRPPTPMQFGSVRYSPAVAGLLESLVPSDDEETADQLHSRRVCMISRRRPGPQALVTLEVG